MGALYENARNIITHNGVLTVANFTTTLWTTNTATLSSTSLIAKPGGITKQIFKMMINCEQDTTITNYVK